MSLKQIREVLEVEFTPSRLSIQRDAGGATYLSVVSSRFVDEPHREALLTRTLEAYGLVLPPYTLTSLWGPGDHDEETFDDLFAASHSVPTWSDALRLEPGLDPPPRSDFGAEVVVCWSPDGEGQTSHSLVAGYGETLILDLNLNAPSLAGVKEDRPRFEALIEAANTEDDEAFAALVRVALDSAPTTSWGAKIIGPECDEEFVHSRLSKLTSRALYRGRLPLHRLIAELVRQSGVKSVLINSTPGYCDESALAVLDLADYVCVCGSQPATSVALKAVENSFQTHGKPRLL